MKAENNTVVPFSEALYKLRCAVCNEKLSWEADFDADGTAYRTTCCGNYYRLYPHSVTVSVEKET